MGTREMAVRDAPLTETQSVAGLCFILSCLLAVADGALQDKGISPSSPGRYARKHPAIVLGAVFSVVGAALSQLERAGAVRRRSTTAPAPSEESCASPWRGLALRAGAAQRPSPPRTRSAPAVPQDHAA